MPTLYVVATPIGNLQDFPPRAVETLKGVGLIAAEDTRVTMKLCQVFDIHTPLTACHQHNEEGKAAVIAERMLAEGIDAALTTDAGMPCVSDPGYLLVRECLNRGIDVRPVPGCCAGVSALSVSGFDAREWAFYGFLPREKKALREKLATLATGPKVAIVHESPFRVIELIETVTEVLPEARLSLSCDLTKLHELTLHGSPAEVLAALRANPKAEKGEYCLVLDLHGVPEPEPPSADPEVSLEARLVEAMLAGVDLRGAQAALVQSGAKKNAVKAAALRLKKLLTEEDT
ncbi:MAG: 16S rRNA (cytidine(1402)-2'-O)-methyltransferase [Clostridia bacterium]|nr:16S rRNA (cytidine(1402)-2'-O)-methyltransferase [Clostridia bacterium]